MTFNLNTEEEEKCLTCSLLRLQDQRTRREGPKTFRVTKEWNGSSLLPGDDDDADGEKRASEAFFEFHSKLQVGKGGREEILHDVNGGDERQEGRGTSDSSVSCSVPTPISLSG